MAGEREEKPLDVCLIPTESPEIVVKKEASFWHIDKEMLRFKIHFFLYIGGLSTAIPFTSVFAKERLGLNATSLGTVLVAQMFLFIFTKPLVGYIADYFNRLKALITILTLITIAGFLLLLPIPKFEQKATLNSSAFSTQNTFHTASLCKQFEDSTRLQGNASVEDCSNLNHIEVYHQDGKCIFCFLNTGSHLSVCAELVVKNKSEDTEILDDATNANKPQILHLLCNETNPINLNLCSYNHQSPSTDCKEIKHLATFSGSNEDYEIKSMHACFHHTQKLSSDNVLGCSQNETNGLMATDGSNPRTISDFQTYQFWTFALLCTLSSICDNAIFTLSDTACCESIQKSGAEFGKQRLWGSIGWGAIAPLAGYINDYTGDFVASWSLMTLMLLLFLWNLTKIDLVKPHFSKNILGDVGTILKSKEFLASEFVIFINGIATGIIWFYLLWFLLSIGGNELLCGLAQTVQHFGGTIPFMFFSDWIIRKVGHFQVLCLSLLVYVIRFMWYSYLYNPWLVLPIEICHGVTYGLYYAVLASYGKLSSKPGTEATTQSIIFSTHEGLGAGLGCVLAGLGFDYLGGHRTFLFVGIFCGVGFVVSVVLFFFIRKQHNTKPAETLSKETTSTHL
ncbi:MFS_1_like domain-containing protein [Caerostris darwini]|uniref:MFS_1_like domain-containing protein n=1 Tax=Caerostris darwini TaxID=1538125 RepID=A0AAV4QZA6_9ARAC|nr:MFS_1_like domain-containing protein [Caerostris darwini]